MQELSPTRRKVTVDRAIWVKEVERVYKQRWKASNVDRQQAINSKVHSLRHQRIEVDESTLARAEIALRKWAVMDRKGLAPQAILAVATASNGSGGYKKSYYMRAIQWALNTDEFYENQEVEAYARAKAAGPIRAEKTRVILPLNAMMQILDAILAHLLEELIEKIFPKSSRPALCYHGGTEPRTQPMDIAHAVQMLVERGLDSKSMMTVAQQDIKSYYDNIDILQILKFITGKGEHPEAQSISRALLNMHTKTKVSIEVGGAQCSIEGRTSGVLTGTRTAGKMGKIQWLHACQQRHAVWEMWSIDVTEEPIGTPDQPQQVGPRKKLGICTWIDNFYCAASTTQAACAIAEDVEAFLKEHWGLEMGADSNKFMPVKSTYREEGDEPPPGWKKVESFPALGHIRMLRADDGESVDATEMQCQQVNAGEAKKASPHA